VRVSGEGVLYSLGTSDGTPIPTFPLTRGRGRWVHGEAEALNLGAEMNARNKMVPVVVKRELVEMEELEVDEFSDFDHELVAAREAAEQELGCAPELVTH